MGPNRPRHIPHSSPRAFKRARYFLLRFPFLYLGFALILPPTQKDEPLPVLMWINTKGVQVHEDSVLPAFGVAPNPHNYRDLAMFCCSGCGHDAEARCLCGSLQPNHKIKCSCHSMPCLLCRVRVCVRRVSHATSSAAPRISPPTYAT